MIVPDVRDWCRKHGLTEANPFRIAVTVRRGDGKYLILLVEAITDQMLPGVYSLLDTRLPDTAVDGLRDEPSFCILFSTRSPMSRMALGLVKRATSGPRSRWGLCDRGQPGPAHRNGIGVVTARLADLVRAVGGFLFDTHLVETLSSSATDLILAANRGRDCKRVLTDP